MIRAPTFGRGRKPQTGFFHLQLNTAAPQAFKRRGEPVKSGGLMTAAVFKLTAVFYALLRAAAKAAERT